MSKRALWQRWMALAVAAGLASCVPASEPAPLEVSAPPFSGIEEVEAALTQLATPCAFASDAGTITITLAAGEYTLVSRSSAGELRVNGAACGTATDSTTTRININGSADGGNETVILDYLRGAFVLGTAAGPGVVIDLKGGTGDKIKVRASTGADVIALGTASAGVGSAGTFAISIAIDGGVPDSNKDITVTGTETVLIATGPGADVINGGGTLYGTGSSPFGTVTSGTSPTLILYGGDGADTLTGGAGNDSLYGEAGDDVVNASAGNDTESGGAGHDTFNEGSAANGADTLAGGSETDGGSGVDTVNYSLRTTSITAALGGGAVSGALLSDGGFERDDVADDIEVVNGGSGNDVLSCALGFACTLHGNGGSDSLTGGSKADTLSGEAGDDTIIPGTGDDVIDCGSGTLDTISYADRGAGSTVAVTLGAAGAATTGNGDTMSGDGGVPEDDSIAFCENIVGGDGSDALTGNEFDNRITGGLGDDVLSGQAGNDIFDEGSASNGGDTFNGGSGEDSVEYSRRTNALICDMSDDTANDGEASENDNIKVDVEDLYGGSGGNTIVAGSADNKINPGSGTNSVTCGAGFDILVPNGNTTNGPSDCEAATAPLVSITVTPANPTSIKSTTRQFTATGHYSDTTTQDLTTSPSLTWASSNTTVAIISNTAGSMGRASTLVAGTTSISATVGAISGSTTLTVTPAALLSIAVTPNSPSVALGYTRTFLAIGTYTDATTQDLSTQVTWSSTATGVAIISNTAGSQGMASTLTEGSSSIRATLGAVVGSTTLTVTAPTLIGPIVVTPASGSVAVGNTQQFTASGDFSDNTTQDITATVTWSSSDQAKATVSNAGGTEGLVTGLEAGSTTITATLGGANGSTDLTVTP